MVGRGRGTDGNLIGGRRAFSSTVVAEGRTSLRNLFRSYFLFHGSSLQRSEIPVPDGGPHVGLQADKASRTIANINRVFTALAPQEYATLINWNSCAHARASRRPGFGLPHENIALRIAKTSTTNTTIVNLDAYQGVE